MNVPRGYIARGKGACLRRFFVSGGTLVGTAELIHNACLGAGNGHIELSIRQQITVQGHHRFFGQRIDLGLRHHQVHAFFGNLTITVDIND